MRPAPVWWAYAACVALAAAAVAWVCATAARLERAEARARRQAALEENLQLALWRMDSALAPLIAEESTRPYFAYGPFYPAERAFTCMFAEIQHGDVLVPSPLLTTRSPLVRLHFQFGPDGRLTSPQAPSGNMRDLAEARYVAPERVEEASRRLEALERLVDPAALAAALPSLPPMPTASETGPGLMAWTDPFATNSALATGSGIASRAANEYAMRTRSAQKAQVAQQNRAVPLVPSSRPVNQGPFQAVWVGPALLLARRVEVEEGTFLQGCWLDWDALRAELLASIADLLPAPALDPVRAPTVAPPARMLATIPARLVPGAVPEPPAEGWSPARVSTAIAWGCLATVALAVALLLRGALALSERRGTFVSAVTHELRTPLTTFRLYTEMLDEGLVAAPEARRSYLHTLRTEADRLAHLVENVLAFARLERRQSDRCRETVTTAELIDRLTPSLSERARQAGMELHVKHPGAPSRLQTNVSMVDQVLTNLVDNAAKYASSADDRRIHLEAVVSGSRLAVSVRDHGPGVSPRAARRLFRPFSKSATDAAHSAPGVGLGLALSRRLARSLGGDLRLESTGARGACFRLTLPLT